MNQNPILSRNNWKKNCFLEFLNLCLSNFTKIIKDWSIDFLNLIILSSIMFFQKMRRKHLWSKCVGGRQRARWCDEYSQSIVEHDRGGAWKCALTLKIRERVWETQSFKKAICEQMSYIYLISDWTIKHVL